MPGRKEAANRQRENTLYPRKRLEGKQTVGKHSRRYPCVQPRGARPRRESQWPAPAGCRRSPTAPVGSCEHPLDEATSIFLFVLYFSSFSFSFRDCVLITFLLLFRPLNFSASCPSPISFQSMAFFHQFSLHVCVYMDPVNYNYNYMSPYDVTCMCVLGLTIRH